VPNGYWKEFKNQKSFFDSVSKKLKINKLDDWYSVTVQQFTKNGGWSILGHFGSLEKGNQFVNLLTIESSYGHIS
jgi:hypothetical protein